jgi:hypothetical protein
MSVWLSGAIDIEVQTRGHSRVNIELHRYLDDVGAFVVNNFHERQKPVLHYQFSRIPFVWSGFCLSRWRSSFLPFANTPLSGWGSHVGVNLSVERFALCGVECCVAELRLILFEEVV